MQNTTTAFCAPDAAMQPARPPASDADRSGAMAPVTAGLPPPIPAGCHGTCVFHPRGALADRTLARIETVLRQHRRARTFHFVLWGWEDLGNSALAEAALADAARINSAAVLLGDDGSVPEFFRQWLGRWQASCAAVSDRLVALFDARSEHARGMPRAFFDVVEFAMNSGVGLVWHRLPGARVRPSVSRTPVESVRMVLAGP